MKDSARLTYCVSNRNDWVWVIEFKRIKGGNTHA